MLLWGSTYTPQRRQAGAVISSRQRRPETTDVLVLAYTSPKPLFRHQGIPGASSKIKGFILGTPAWNLPLNAVKRDQRLGIASQWERRSPSLCLSKESFAFLKKETFLLMILTGPGFVTLSIAPFNLAVTDYLASKFWELPESTEDVFSLFTPADIRRTRDNALSNFETLLLSITSRLTVLKNHPSFPDPELAPPKDALNCIRILTRVLPFAYEAEHLEDWEEKFFWSRRKKKTRQAQISSEVLFDEAQAEEQRDQASPRTDDYEDVKPLAEEIIDTVLDLLFYTDFTIPQISTATSKVSHSIWQSGVGCNTSMGSNKEMENNRCEILRLLLTLTSKAMYISSSKCCVSCFSLNQLTFPKPCFRYKE